MRIEARHSYGQIVFEITAENASDRAALGLFDQMNNKGNQRRIVCSGTYSCDVSAITQLTISGLDVQPPYAVYPVMRAKRWNIQAFTKYIREKLR